MRLRSIKIIAAIALSLFAICANGSSSIKIEFGPVVVMVPDWDEKERVDAGVSGKLRLDKPGGDGDYVRLFWDQGPPMSAEQEIETGKIYDVSTVELSAIKTNANLMASLYKKTPRRANMEWATSYIYCKNQDVTIKISTFTRMGWSETLAMHSEIAKSATCKNTQLNKYIYPVFKATSKQTQDGGVVYYIMPDGIELIFTARYPNAELIIEKNHEPLMKNMIYGLLPNISNLDVVSVYSVGFRKYISAMGNINNKKMRVLGVWWDCDDKKSGHIGIATSGEATDNEYLQTIIDKASCQ